MKYTPIISSDVRPTDVKIYIEDGVPYLDYIGTFYATDGSKCKVHFPKIGLTFSKVMQEKRRRNMIILVINRGLQPSLIFCSR